MGIGLLIRRALLYVGLAITALAVFTLIFFLTVHTHTSVDFRWVAFAMFTGLLVGVIIKLSPGYRARPAFWLLLFGFMSIHSALFVLIIDRAVDFRPIWYVPVVIAEAYIFGLLSSALLRSNRVRTRKRRHNDSGGGSPAF